MELISCRLSGAYKCDVTPRILGSSYTPGMKYEHLYYFLFSSLSPLLIFILQFLLWAAIAQSV
jgi:hypothetical protein